MIMMLMIIIINWLLSLLSAPGRKSSSCTVLCDVEQQAELFI